MNESESKESFERDAMRVLGLSVLALSMLVLPAVLHADDHNEAKEIDPLAMYRPYAGKWESVTKNRVTNDGDPVEFETKGQWVQREILDGAMVELNGLDEMNDEPYSYLWLYGYDMPEKSHVGWFHDQNGANAKFYGDWSEEDKKMTWTLAEKDDMEFFVTIIDDLSDPDRIGFTFKMEDGKGRVVFTQEGYATRAEEE